MKITMLAHTIPPDGGISLGIARYAYNLCCALERAGNDVTMYVRKGTKKTEPWTKTIYAPKFSWIPYQIFSGCKMLGVESDVYHSDYVTTGAALRWSGRKPVVAAMHDAIPFTYDNTKLNIKQILAVRWFMKCFSSIKKAEAVVMASNDAKKEVIRLTDIDPARVHAVHYGIDHSVFKPSRKNRGKKLKVGYLGGLDGRKNVGLLLDAFDLLQRNDVELHIAGYGSNLNIFRKRKISGAYFHGPISPEKAPEFYNSLDIFVMPSLQEGFGMMTLEAMSCGLPVIGVNRSSTPEIIGNAGLLVEPDAHSLAKTIEKLLERDSIRERLAYSCLKRSRDFTWERCASDNMKIYSMLGKH